MSDYKASHVGPDRGVLYDERYRMGPTDFYWTNFERPLLESIFADLALKSEPRYLDFAVGTARILQIASKYFPDATGVDISADMLRQAKKTVPEATLIQADVTKEELDIGQFDLISMFRFLLNAEPELRLRILTWLREHIREDGLLVINNHMNKWSLTGMACRIDNFRRHEERHNILSDQQVEEMLSKTGFRIVEHYGFNYLLTHPRYFLLWRRLTLHLERTLGRFPFLRRVAKDRIYVCRPC